MAKVSEEKLREKAAKLKNPTPVELPSGIWRCQVMISGKRVGFIDSDPGIAYAKAVAYRERVLLEAEQPKTNLTLATSIYRIGMLYYRHPQLTGIVRLCGIGSRN